jgi:anti-sigma factor RsiW
MKTCEELKAALVELVFGEPDPGTGLDLNRHLAECAACREEERRLLALHDAVAGPEPRPSEALRERIRASLPAPRAGRLAALWRPLPACAAVAVCLAGILLVLVVPRGDRPATGSADGGPRAQRLPASAVAPSFVPAQPFDTGLVVAAPRESLADSALPVRSGDSL